MKRVLHSGLHRFFYLLLAIGLLVVACKKGDPGPQGDKGDKGDAGAKGDKGDKGDNGASAVQYSPWLDLTYSLDSSVNVYFTQINETKLTDNFLSTGDVKVYMNLGTPTDKVIFTLPYVSGSANIRPVLATGLIELDATVNASSYTDTNGKKRLQYRYVLIPGGTALRSATNINWNNYEEVKKYLGLKD